MVAPTHPRRTYVPPTKPRYPRIRPQVSGQGILQKVDVEGQRVVHTITHEDGSLLLFRTAMGDAALLFNDSNQANCVWASCYCALGDQVQTSAVLAKDFLSDVDSEFPENLSALAVVTSTDDVNIHRDPKTQPWTLFSNLVQDLVSYGKSALACIDRTVFLVPGKVLPTRFMGSFLESPVKSEIKDVQGFLNMVKWIRSGTEFGWIPDGLVET